MVKKVLIVKNVHREGPGLIRTILENRKIPFEVINVTTRNEFPKPTDYSAVIVLGGPQSANDKSMESELEFIAKTVEAEVPYLGVCLGMQALVKAAGGEVYLGPFREVGCRDSKGLHYQVELTQDGVVDPLFTEVESHFKIFQLHGETVKLSSNVKLIGKGYGEKQIPNQVVRVGKNAYGVQGHLELTQSMLERWLQQDPMLESFRTGALAERLRADYDTIKADYQITGRILFNNFLQIAGLS